MGRSAGYVKTAQPERGEIVRMGIIKRMVFNLQRSMDIENRKALLSICDRDSARRLLDCGCGDGEFTLELGKRIGAGELHAFEIADEYRQQAERRGISVCPADLNEPLPADDESFDVVCANQVIEHLHHTDLFIKEVWRILKPGGCALIGTPNLAAWHNIAFLLMGQQPLTAFVSDEVYDVGNSFGRKRGLRRTVEHPGHLRIFTYRALREIFEHHGFCVERIAGVGYCPWRASLPELTRGMPCT